MFIQPCFIRKNTKELRDKLKDLGYEYCPQYDTSCDSLHTRGSNILHGRPYFVDEHYTDLDSNNSFDGIDCEENDDLFLAIAALRDDTDKNQYFKHNSKNHFYKCDIDSFKDYFAICNKELNDHIEDYHKATIDELKELLNTKKIYCSKCGGTNILKEAWIDANTLIYVNDTYSDRYYCEDCMEEVNVTIK